ncbi:MAG: AAA family ATPase [Methanobacteriota archaeon]
MKAIAFTGLPGAGKSVAVEVARRRGIPVVRMGDLVWEEVRRRGMPLEEASVGLVAREMRAHHGPEIWAIRTAERAKETDAPVVVIDGVRSLAEVSCFRRVLGRTFVLVAITAAKTVREARLLDRGREDDVRSREEFEAREARELGFGLEEAIGSADVRIPNEETEADLVRRVEEVLA